MASSLLGGDFGESGEMPNNRISFLVVIMMLIALVIGAVSIGALYNTAYEVKRNDLIQLAKSQARLIEAVLGPMSKIHPSHADAETMDHIQTAVSTYKGFAETGEFVLGRRADNHIQFLMRHRHSASDAPPKPIAIDEQLAEPMRRALNGISGTVVALDYRGETVLAAHEPVRGLAMGLVAKIDMAEFRAPFLKAAAIVITISALLVAVGAYLFFAITNPISRRIERSEARLRAIFETSADGILVIDDTGLVQHVNPAGCAIFDFAAEDVLGKDINVLIPRAERPGEGQQNYMSRLSGDPGCELFGLRRDGSRFPIALNLAEADLDGGHMFVGIVRDISERKKVEESLKTAMVQANAANAAKSAFLSSMSHELRTPLNAILGFSHLLQMDTANPLSDEQVESVRFIEDGGNHLLDLINQVLDLDKIEKGSLDVAIELVRPDESLKHCCAMAKTMAEKKGVLLEDRTDVSVLPTIRADRIRLRQVLLNFLSNAIKYNRPDGTVVVDAKVIADRYLRFLVTDSGKGIANHHQSGLFVPFSRLGAANSDIEGTGIGLSISKQLVHLMDGELGFETAEGVGSTFWFQLPLAAAHASVSVGPQD